MVSAGFYVVYAGFYVVYAWCRGWCCLLGAASEQRNRANSIVADKDQDVYAKLVINL